MDKPYEISTKRLVLKSAHPSYAEQVCQYLLRNRDALQEWLPLRDNKYYYKLEAQVKILTTKAESFENAREYRFYLFDKAGNIIGDLGFSNVTYGAFCSCFVGYQMDKDQMGKGYMTEALKAGIDFIFNEKKLHRVEAHVMPTNKASISVLQKLNFIEEGYSKNYLRINGKWEDHLRFALINHNVA